MMHHFVNTPHMEPIRREIHNVRWLDPCIQLSCHPILRVELLTIRDVGLDCHVQIACEVDTRDPIMNHSLCLRATDARSARGDTVVRLWMESPHNKLLATGCWIPQDGGFDRWQSLDPQPESAGEERCGKAAAPFIPRWGMSPACYLPKGHEGECIPGGECFRHGFYLNSCPLCKFSTE